MPLTVCKCLPWPHAYKCSGFECGAEIQRRQLHLLFDFIAALAWQALISQDLQGWPEAYKNSNSWLETCIVPTFIHSLVLICWAIVHAMRTKEREDQIHLMKKAALCGKSIPLLDYIHKWESSFSCFNGFHQFS